jgi:hypothetical protein
MYKELNYTQDELAKELKLQILNNVECCCHNGGGGITTDLKNWTIVVFYCGISFRELLQK